MKTIEFQRNDVNYGNPLTVKDAVVIIIVRNLV